MSFNREDATSQLFLVRVRAGEAGEGPQAVNKVWYGRVQRVVTGETYDFQGWAELIKRLGTLLDDTQAGNDIDE